MWGFENNLVWAKKGNKGDVSALLVADGVVRLRV